MGAPFVSRILRRRNERLMIQVFFPERVDDDEWHARFTLDDGVTLKKGRVIGHDSVGAMLNTFTTVRQLVEKLGDEWSVYEDGEGDWHLFPYICPLLTREFDQRAEVAVQQELENYYSDRK